MQGRHSDNDLDKTHRSRWRLVLLWLMIALATIVMIMVARGMINKVQSIGSSSSPSPADSPFAAGDPQGGVADPSDAPETVTPTITVPGPVVERRVTVAGPRTTVTKTMTSATPSPVPGPTVTVKVSVPGPTVTSRVPEPKETVYQKADPAPTVTHTETVTKCYLLKKLIMIEIPCP